MKVFEALIPSDKKFGFFFGFIFATACLYFLLIGNSQTWATISGILFLITLLITITKPALMHPFNKLWFKFGLLLGKIISPIVLGLIFFVIITPVGLLMRLAGRDELQLKLNDSHTHWKIRSPVGPQPDSFKNQY